MDWGWIIILGWVGGMLPAFGVAARVFRAEIDVEQRAALAGLYAFSWPVWVIVWPVWRAMVRALRAMEGVA